MKIGMMAADAWRATGEFFGLRRDPSNHGSNTRSRDLTAWRPSRKSADLDLIPEKGTLVSRSRDLERNNGIAKGGIRTLGDHVVGTGLKLVPKPNYLVLGRTKEWADEWSRNVRAHWVTWSDTTACDVAKTQNFDQLSLMQWRAQLVSGDAFARILWLPDRGDGFATKLQSIDSDRLSNPNGQMNSQTLRDGVVIDEWGAPVGYWVRTVHPNDFNTGLLDFGKWDYIGKYAPGVPNGRQQAVHNYDKDRTGLSRGSPILTPVLANFKGIDRYIAAEIQGAVVQAMLAMTITTEMDQESILSLFKNDHEAYLKARRDHAVELESGSVLPLFPGDQPNFLTPNRPASGFDAFVTNICRMIGVSTGMPYGVLMKDFSKDNYSAMRAAMLEAFKAFVRMRDDFSSQWCDPIYRCVLEEMIHDGRVTDADDFYDNIAAYTRCMWIGPGRGMVDPVKEAQAYQLQQEAMVSTLELQCAEQGLFYEDVLEQLGAERKLRIKLGLPEIVAGRATILPGTSDGEIVGANPSPGVPGQQGNGTTP